MSISKELYEEVLYLFLLVKTRRSISNLAIEQTFLESIIIGLKSSSLRQALSGLLARYTR